MLPPGVVGVKICGITNPGDLALSVEAGASAIGFNFYRGSKRFIEMERERDWLKDSPDSIQRVAVAVNPTEAEALSWLSEPFIDALQLHGDEDLQFCESISQKSGKEVIKALRVADADSFRAVENFATFPVLLDAFAGSERGGTGKTFDWALLEALKNREHILLSGGLNPENVSAALRATRVRYVDVASGVETTPRQKDAARVRAFIANARKTGL